MKRALFFILFSVLSLSAASGQLRPEVALPSVYVPTIPAKLDFAGEPVPLHNFDTRESLIREMLVTSCMHSRTMLTLLSAGRYFDIMEPILAKHGVPRDFLYLCMAESGLAPNAVSGAGAGGIWQILSGTARDYGLLVNSDVDERYDVAKSTEAACKYLKESYDKFGSWTLAAAAYNVGNAGLDRRLKSQGVDNYYDVYLPTETMRYIFRVLSFKVITERPALYGYSISPGDQMRPLNDYHTVTLSVSPIDWSEVARDNGTNYKMLRELNNWIRTYSYANKENRTFTLKVPNSNFRKK